MLPPSPSNPVTMMSSRFYSRRLIHTVLKQAEIENMLMLEYNTRSAKQINSIGLMLLW